MTNWDARQTSCVLDFLDEGQTYTMTAYADAEDSGQFPVKLEIVNANLTRGDSLSISMVSGGGFAAILKPVSE